MSEAKYYRCEDGSLVNTLERFCQEVPPIAAEFPRDDQIFDADDGLPIPEIIKEHFRYEGRLTESQVTRILELGTAILKKEDNLLKLPAPIVICGDIHGQYYDLLKLFEVADGGPPKQTFLFLGDYVDRGYFSLECYLLLLALKIRHPTKIFMLRGNHECRHLTKHFTFRLECMQKYGESVYDLCMDSFDSLAIAAVVNDQFFCVHGGLSPQVKKPSDVNSFDRIKELPKSGTMCDLLWSDPASDYGSEYTNQAYLSNTTRGCSYKYTYKAVTEFLRHNKLLAVIRGHEAQDAGYRLYRQGPDGEFPSLITVFSAANYVDVYRNKGAIIKYDGNLINVRQYSAAPHPYHLPKFMNAFDWSLPFVGEKIADLLAAVLHIPTLSHEIEGLSQAELDEIEEKERIAELKDVELSPEDESSLEIIQDKIEALEEVAEMCAEMREEREMVSEINNEIGAVLQDAAESETLILAEQELVQDIHHFKEAFKCDVANEHIPPIKGHSSACTPLSTASPQLVDQHGNGSSSNDHHTSSPDALSSTSTENKGSSSHHHVDDSPPPPKHKSMNAQNEISPFEP